MEYQVSFKLNEHLFLRDPELSELGKQIVKNAIDLIYEIGFEQFTFKKLALKISTTEASIYRYFENKYKLLLYILNWYWSYMNFLLDLQLNNITDKFQKLEIAINLLAENLPTTNNDYNGNYLNNIVIAESSKAYLVKDITEINKVKVFQPYKELCHKISLIFLGVNKKYKFPHSLSSTIIEASHFQKYFYKNLPALTDGEHKNANEFVAVFLKDLVYKSLGI